MQVSFFCNRSKQNANIELKNILIAYLTKSLSSSLEMFLEEDIAVAESKASSTTSARSVMKEDMQLRAGTCPQF